MYVYTETERLRPSHKGLPFWNLSQIDPVSHSITLLPAPLAGSQPGFLDEIKLVRRSKGLGRLHGYTGVRHASFFQWEEGPSEGDVWLEGP